MKKFNNITIGNGNRIFSEVQIINQFLNEGQKKVKFDELNEYCRLKKNINFLQKRFKKIGFVPSFFVKDDMFYCIKVVNYKYRGREYESVSCLPVVSAHGKFKRFELN